MYVSHWAICCIYSNPKAYFLHNYVLNTIMFSAAPVLRKDYMCLILSRETTGCV